MTFLKTAAAVSAAFGASLALAACSTAPVSPPTTGAQAEIDNATNINSNGSVQPGRAGPSPTGGYSNPGTSGSISANPGAQQPQ